MRTREQIYREQQQLNLEEERLAREEQILLARHEAIDRFELGLEVEDHTDTKPVQKQRPQITIRTANPMPHKRRRPDRVSIWPTVTGIIIFIYFAPIGAAGMLNSDARWYGLIMLTIGLGAVILGLTYGRWKKWLDRM